MPELSVILCTLAEADEIEPLRLLAAGDFEDYDVVIRRDAGLAAARNAGVREASADKLLFIDDDAYPCEGYLRRIVADLDRYPVVGGKVIDPTGGPGSWATPAYDQGDEPKLTTRLIGCNMAFRREVFEAVGGFDENIVWGHEESDLVDRAVDAGFEVFYDPEAAVVHTYADGVRDYWRTMFKYGRADVYRDRKAGVPEWRRLHWYLPLRRGGSLREVVVESVAAGYRAAGRLSALRAGVPAVPEAYPDVSSAPSPDASSPDGAVVTTD